MAGFRFHYAELLLLSSTIIGVLIPFFGPLTVCLRLAIWDSWTVISVMTPLTIMNILIGISWPPLIAVSITRFPEGHSEPTARLGLRRLIYFILLVAAIILFWPVLIRALPNLPVGTRYIYIPEFEGGLIRPSAGVSISLIYFFYILIANISVWSFGHFKRLRIANPP
ncbi:MAG: hypothetical protein ACFFBS_04705 [Promethearchaeota archaeon]